MLHFQRPFGSFQMKDCLYLLMWHRPHRRGLLDIEELGKLYNGAAAEVQEQRVVEPCLGWRPGGSLVTFITLEMPNSIQGHWGLA